MAFYEIEFPRKLSFGSAGGRGFSTTENEGFSGWRQWNQNWEFPLGDWTISVRSQKNASIITDFDLLRNFHANMKGKAHGFRFWAPGDSVATGAAIGTGDGNTVTFQLQNTYTIGGLSFSIPITKPIMSTVTDYQGNALTDTVVAYVNGTPTGIAVDATTGQITFAAAPANGAIITADFQFHFPVHFKSDKFNAQVEQSNPAQPIFNLASMEIEEVRVRISGLS